MEKPVTVYIFKVNIQCCNACPRNISKNLRKIAGVHAVDIEREDGLVKVTGKVKLDPTILMNTIRKTKKVVEFLSVAINQPKDNLPEIVNETPKPDKIKSQNSRSSSSSHGKNGDHLEKKIMENTECDNGNDININGGNSGHCSHSHHQCKPFEKRHINEPVNPSVAPPYMSQPYIRAPPQFGPTVVHGNQLGFPRMSNPYSSSMPPPMPMTYGRYYPTEPTPWMPASTNYYHQQEMPMGEVPPPQNPVHSIFSDDNVNGCVIV